MRLMVTDRTADIWIIRWQTGKETNLSPRRTHNEYSIYSQISDIAGIRETNIRA